MKKASFQKLKARLQQGDLLVFRKLLDKHGAATMGKLMDQTGCSQSVAEQVWLDAVLLFRNRVISGRVQELHDLRTYLYQVSMDVYRQDHIGSRTTNPVSLKNFFYELSRRYYNREVQDEVVRTDPQYFSDLVDATRLATYQLEEEGKQILQLFYFYKQSFQKIGEMLGIPEDEVRRRKTRYYSQLMDSISKHLERTYHEE